MKRFLIVLCFFNLQYYLKALPASELLNQTYVDIFDGCGDYKDLQDEIKNLKKILEEKYINPVTVTEKPSIAVFHFSQLKADIQSLNGTIREFLDNTLNTADKEMIHLIKENGDVLNKKINDLEQAQNTKNIMLDQLNVNVKELLQKLSEEQSNFSQVIQTNIDLVTKFEVFRDGIFQHMDTKFEQQENDLRNLKAQNEQFITEFKKLSELLNQQIPQLKEQTHKIENMATEKHESVTNHFKSLNETLLEHFGKHATKLNQQENILKAIKTENSNLQTNFDSKCSKCENNKQLLESLLARFDEVQSQGKKQKDSGQSNDESNEFEGMDIFINIVDSLYPDL